MRGGAVIKHHGAGSQTWSRGKKLDYLRARREAHSSTAVGADRKIKVLCPGGKHLNRTDLRLS